MKTLTHIGFGNMVNSDKMIAVLQPDSAPVKRIVQHGKEQGIVVDATQGRKTKAVKARDNSTKSRDINGRRRMNQKGILVVVSGFSGAGKGTLMKKLVTDYENYALSVSMTTRQPRTGEVDGRDYFFVTDEEYCGHYYGTPKDFVEKNLEEGKDVILEIEIQGAHKVRAQYPDAVLLFVMPPSAKELYNRLTGRATETEEVIRQRMLRAVEESEGIDTYDYIVVNDKLEDCIAQINTIVNAARHTPSQNIEFIGEIRKELKEFLGSR